MLSFPAAHHRSSLRPMSSAAPSSASSSSSVRDPTLSEPASPRSPAGASTNKSTKHDKFEVKAVTIPYGAEKEGVVYYTVNVITTAGEKWSCRKRFSAFERLHQVLIELFGHRGFPPGADLPPKKFKFFVSHVSDHFIEERRCLLDSYLQKMLKVPEVVKSDVWLDFLSSDELPEFVEPPVEHNDALEDAEITSVSIPQTRLMSFAPDTLVRAADGTVLPASAVHVGDTLLGASGAAKRVRLTQTGTAEQMYRVCDAAGRTYTVTPNHLLVLSWSRGPSILLQPAQNALKLQWTQRGSLEQRSALWPVTSEQTYAEAEAFLRSSETQALQHGELVEITAGALHARWDQLSVRAALAETMPAKEEAKRLSGTSESAAAVAYKPARSADGTLVASSPAGAAQVCYVLSSPVGLRQCEQAQQRAWTLAALQPAWQTLGMDALASDVAIVELPACAAAEKALCEPVPAPSTSEALLACLHTRAETIVAFGPDAAALFRTQLPSEAVLLNAATDNSQSMQFSFQGLVRTVHFCSVHPSEKEGAQWRSVVASLSHAHCVSMPSSDAALFAQITCELEQPVALSAVNQLGKHAYVSIKVDGDGRFVLADGTLTHNSDHVLYQVDVCNAKKRKTFSKWTVLKRFGQFFDLDTQLRADFADNESQLATLPASPQRQSKLLYDHMEAHFIEHRRVLLEHYLVKLLNIPAVAKNSNFLAFLGVQM